MGEKITCTGPCGEAKDATEFYGKSKKCKVCTLARQKDLKASKAAGGGKAKAKKKSAGKGKRVARKAAKTTTAPGGHVLFVPAGGFGLSATLETDKATGHTDIHLEQTTKELGAQNVWLSQLEAQSLASWLNENLGGRE